MDQKFNIKGRKFDRQTDNGCGNQGSAGASGGSLGVPVRPGGARWVPVGPGGMFIDIPVRLGPVGPRWGPVGPVECLLTPSVD